MPWSQHASRSFSTSQGITDEVASVPYRTGYTFTTFLSSTLPSSPADDARSVSSHSTALRTASTATPWWLLQSGRRSPRFCIANLGTEMAGNVPKTNEVLGGSAVRADPRLSSPGATCWVAVLRVKSRRQGYSSVQVRQATSEVRCYRFDTPEAPTVVGVQRLLAGACRCECTSLRVFSWWRAKDLRHVML